MFVLTRDHNFTDDDGESTVYTELVGLANTVDGIYTKLQKDYEKYTTRKDGTLLTFELKPYIQSKEFVAKFAGEDVELAGVYGHFSYRSWKVAKLEDPED